MSRRKFAIALAGSLAVVGIGAAGFAADDRTAIKGMMGENFAGLQTLLIALITSNYAAVPDQIDSIHEHASELTRMVPENAESNRDQFLGYAYNLQGHAADVKSIVEVLIATDAARSKGESVSTDHLRESLAAHYGGMVNMCVACHNRFRPPMVE